MVQKYSLYVSYQCCVILQYVSQSVFDSMFFKSSDTFDSISQLKPSTKTKEPSRGELAVKLRHQMCSAFQFSTTWKSMEWQEAFSHSAESIHSSVNGKLSNKQEQFGLLKQYNKSRVFLPMLL